MHQFSIIGTVQAAPKTFGKKNNVARFTVLVPDMDTPKYTNYLKIVAFDHEAEEAARWLTEGTEVKIDGKIRSSRYEKDGEKRYVDAELVALNVAPLSGALTPTEQEERELVTAGAPQDDNDIPF